MPLPASVSKRLGPKKEVSSGGSGARSKEGVHLYNFAIPVSLFENLKKAARDKGISVNKLLIQITQDWLDPM